MSHRAPFGTFLFAAAGLVYFTASGLSQSDPDQGRPIGFDGQISEHARQMMKEANQIFRYDTFGDEAYWTDTIELHQAIEGGKLGGVGPGVSPNTARRPD